MAEQLQDRVSRGYMFALGRRNIFRRLLKLAVAPVYYMRMTNQARSMLGGWPVDRMGKPVPMFTYPAIDYLLNDPTAIRPQTEPIHIPTGANVM